MEENKNKKSGKPKQSDTCDDFGKILRSLGILVPETEEEIQIFNFIYGDIVDELPERFKNLDFLFKDRQKKDAPVIPLNPIVHLNDNQLSYAARDGQETLPIHVMNKMKELKNKNREKKSSSKK